MINNCSSVYFDEKENGWIAIITMYGITHKGEVRHTPEEALKDEAALKRKLGWTEKQTSFYQIKGRKGRYSD